MAPGPNTNDGHPILHGHATQQQAGQEQQGARRHMAQIAEASLAQRNDNENKKATR
jgi:hypothetical protein